MQEVLASREELDVLLLGKMSMTLACWLEAAAEMRRLCARYRDWQLRSVPLA